MDVVNLEHVPDPRPPTYRKKDIVTDVKEFNLFDKYAVKVGMKSIMFIMCFFIIIMCIMLIMFIMFIFYFFKYCLCIYIYLTYLVGKDREIRSHDGARFPCPRTGV